MYHPLPIRCEYVPVGSFPGTNAKKSKKTGTTTPAQNSKQTKSAPKHH